MPLDKTSPLLTRPLKEKPQKFNSFSFFFFIDISIDLMVTKDYVRELENKLTGKEKFKI